MKTSTGIFSTLGILLILVAATIANAQVNPPLIEWQRTFGGPMMIAQDGATSQRWWIYSVRFSDSGARGNKVSNNFGGYDFWIVRTDTNGNNLWDASYGSTTEDVLFSIRQSSDGGFIVGGFSFSDVSGNKLWDRSFGGKEDDSCRCLEQTPEGGFILGGASSLVQARPAIKPALHMDRLIFGSRQRFANAQVNPPLIEWQRTFGGTNDDRLRMVRSWC